MKIALKNVGILMTLLLAWSTLLMADDAAFPLRKLYPQIKTISTQDMITGFDAMRMIDVRSQLEFNVVHMKGAINIPVSRVDFEKKILALGETKPIVFYCNGLTCAKSYKAAQRMREADYTNILTYDAGIFSWVKASPEKSVLLNETPVNPNKIISEADFINKKLSYDKFKVRAQSKNAYIVDIREYYQLMDSQSPTLMLDKSNIHHYPSDKFLSHILTLGRYKNRPMFIADAVGKQVRWVQYYLDLYGYTNYYFLDGGINAIKPTS